MTTTPPTPDEVVTVRRGAIPLRLKLMVPSAVLLVGLASTVALVVDQFARLTPGWKMATEEAMVEAERRALFRLAAGQAGFSTEVMQRAVGDAEALALFANGIVTGEVLPLNATRQYNPIVWNQFAWDPSTCPFADVGTSAVPGYEAYAGTALNGKSADVAAWNTAGGLGMPSCVSAASCPSTSDAAEALTSGDSGVVHRIRAGSLIDVISTTLWRASTAAGEGYELLYFAGEEDGSSRFFPYENLASWQNAGACMDNSVACSLAPEVADTTTVDGELRNSFWHPACRPWYNAAKIRRRAVISEPYVFSNNGLLGLTVSVPIYNDSASAGGILWGVSAIDFSFSPVDEVVSSAKVLQTGYGMLISLGDDPSGSAGTIMSYRLCGETCSEHIFGGDSSCLCRSAPGPTPTVLDLEFGVEGSEGDRDVFSSRVLAPLLSGETIQEETFEKFGRKWAIAVSPVYISTLASDHLHDRWSGSAGGARNEGSRINIEVASVAILAPVEELRAAFTIVEERLDESLQMASTVLVAGLIVIAVLSLGASYIVIQSIVSPIEALIPIVMAMNNGDIINMELKKPKTGSLEIDMLYRTFEQLIVVIQFGNESLYAGKSKEAGDMYLRALALFENLGNQKGVGIACNNLGVLKAMSVQHGDSESAEIALSYLRAAVVDGYEQFMQNTSFNRANFIDLESRFSAESVQIDEALGRPLDDDAESLRGQWSNRIDNMAQVYRTLGDRIGETINKESFQRLAYAVHNHDSDLMLSGRPFNAPRYVRNSCELAKLCCDPEVPPYGTRDAWPLLERAKDVVLFYADCGAGDVEGAEPAEYLWQMLCLAEGKCKLLDSATLGAARCFEDALMAKVGRGLLSPQVHAEALRGLSECIVKLFHGKPECEELAGKLLSDAQELLRGGPPPAVAFCIDTSGSMATANRMANARLELCRILDLYLNPSQVFSIWSFNHQVRQLVPASIRPQTSAELQGVFDTIMSLWPGGGTAMYQAMDMALTDLNRFVPPGGMRPFLVVLTDGEDNHAFPSFKESVAQSLIVHRYKIIIVGVRLSPAIRQEMEYIVARANHSVAEGGSMYVDVSSDDSFALSRAFDVVGKSIKESMTLSIEQY